MISDVLFEAEASIEEYLDGGGYGKPNDPLRDAIENLLDHMKAVRITPGMDVFPVSEESTALYFEAVQTRWPGVPMNVS